MKTKKIIIELPETVLNYFAKEAKYSGHSRKKLIEIILTEKAKSK